MLEHYYVMSNGHETFVMLARHPYTDDGQALAGPYLEHADAHEARRNLASEQAYFVTSTKGVLRVNGPVPVDKPTKGERSLHATTLAGPYYTKYEAAEELENLNEPIEKIYRIAQEQVRVLGNERQRLEENYFFSEVPTVKQARYLGLAAGEHIQAEKFLRWIERLREEDDMPA